MVNINIDPFRQDVIKGTVIVLTVVIDQMQNSIQQKTVLIKVCNFGTEDIVCKIAKELNLPVLLWGPPRSPRPLPKILLSSIKSPQKQFQNS